MITVFLPYPYTQCGPKIFKKINKKQTKGGVPRAQQVGLLRHGAGSYHIQQSGEILDNYAYYGGGQQPTTHMTQHPL